MPTYEYRCPEGHDFERFYRKISDAAAEVSCPKCGKIAERRLSAGAGFAFKGSGFYLTDYGKNAHRTSGSAPAPKNESGGGSSESGKSEGGSSGSGDSGSPSSTPATPAASEAKPAVKAETKPTATTPTKPKSDK